MERTSLPSSGAIVVSDRKPRLYGVCCMYTLTLLSAIGGFLFGYDTGIISGAMLLLVAQFHFTPHQQSLIVCITLVGCIVAAFGAVFLTECFGRRRTVQLNSLVFAAGAVMMATSTGLHTLLAGRFVVGLAVGIASVVVPMYIAEAAPPSQRGTLVALNHVFVTGGHFAACVVAGLFTHVDVAQSWRWMFGLAALPAFIQLIGFLCLPESPRWLAKYQGKDRARHVLRQLRGTDDVSVELASIMASIDEHSHLDSSSLRCCAAVQGAPVRRAMMLGCMLQLIQQLAGINTVMYYLGTVFVMAGFTTPSVAVWLTTGVSFVGWLSCCFGVVAVDTVGRRKLTLTSLAMVVLALLALGAGFFWLERTAGSSGSDSSGSDSEQPRTAVALALVAATAVYLAAFQPGMGAMPWTLNSEIYPMHARSLGMSVSTIVHWVANLLVSYTFLPWIDIVGAPFAFWSYAAFGLFGWGWLTWSLPETRGLCLEEIEEVFTRYADRVAKEYARRDVSSLDVHKYVRVK